MFPDPVTGEMTEGIARVRYSHDAMIDLLVAEPMITQNTIAEIFNRTPSWISQVVNSDAFQARLAERKEQLIDPVLTASIKDRLAAVAGRSLQLVLDRLQAPLYDAGMGDSDFLMKAAKLSTDALGYGARAPAAGHTTQVAVVIQVPPKIASAQEWASVYQPPT